VTAEKVLLTFDGLNLANYDNGVGQLDVLVNGQLVVDIPAGLNHLSGSGNFASYSHVLVNFGPFDITSMVQKGNTIVFQDPLRIHNGQAFNGHIRNVKIVQGSTVLLSEPRNRLVAPSFSVTYKFSNPPLVLASFVTPSIAGSSGQTVAFTATFTAFGIVMPKMMFRTRGADPRAGSNASSNLF
jgi:hypothetical protein